MAAVSSHAVAQRQKRLYGPARRAESEKLQRLLKASSVAQSGDYNFDERELVRSFWKPVSSTDFKAQKPEDFGRRAPITNSQFEQHFDFGDGSKVPRHVFATSRTREDFDHAAIRNARKAEIVNNDREPHWADMSARFYPKNRLTKSLYDSAFSGKLPADLAGPMFPRRAVPEHKLPAIQPHADHLSRLRGVSVVLGSDSNIKPVSESHNSFQLAPIAGKSKDQDDLFVAMMREKNIKSHALRPGDYNDEAPDSRFASIFMGDFGRSSVTADVKNIYHVKKLDREKAPALPKLTEGPLSSWKRSGEEVKKMHNARGVTLGSDERSLASMYGKDFGPRTNPPPAIRNRPPDSDLMHRAAEGSSGGSTAAMVSSQLQWQQNVEAARRNMRQLAGSIALASELEANTSDRQVSLSHNDYAGPPEHFSPGKALAALKQSSDPIRQAGAFAAGRVPPATSESKTNFRFGPMLAAPPPVDLRARALETKTTHFAVGCDPPVFSSESAAVFRGLPRQDGGIPPAGKPTEEGDEEEKLWSAAEPARLPLHRVSLMQNDFQIPKTSGFTAAQKTQNDAMQREAEQPRFDSHLFHMDSLQAGRFETTNQADFVQPVMMTGQKLLAGR